VTRQSSKLESLAGLAGISISIIASDSDTIDDTFGVSLLVSAIVFFVLSVSIIGDIFTEDH